MSMPGYGASRKTSSSSMNDDVNNAFEFCLRAVLPPEFPCGDRFGEEWVSTLWFKPSFSRSTSYQHRRRKTC